MLFYLYLLFIIKFNLLFNTKHFLLQLKNQTIIIKIRISTDKRVKNFLMMFFDSSNFNFFYQMSKKKMVVIYVRRLFHVENNQYC